VHLVWISSLVPMTSCVPARSAVFGPVDREVRSHQRLQAELGVAASQIADATVLPPLDVDLNYKRGLDGAGSETECCRCCSSVSGAPPRCARRPTQDWEAGPALRIGIPLFDQQQGPRARALAEQQRASRALAATRTELGGEVEATRSRVDKTFTEARQLFDVVLPLRKRVLDETVLQYNAMNATPFELLVAKRDMVDVGRQLIDAQRRYWTAVAQAKALGRGVHVPTSENTP